MLKKCFKNVRNNSPLIHSITNYVTVNDCANILLAIGASPIMADEKEEIEEITSLCSGLCINIGTLNKRTIESMLLAATKAGEQKKAILLDPVGVGASNLRTKTAQELIKTKNLTVIRGNNSEIKVLSEGSISKRGVDAELEDAINDKTLAENCTRAKEFSKKTGAIIVISGEKDIVSNGQKCYIIKNGHPFMSKVTGTGCMLSAILTAFIAANKEAPFEAAAAATCTMGYCGELAYKRMLIDKKEGKLSGNASFRNYLIDAIGCIDENAFIKGARYELY